MLKNVWSTSVSAATKLFEIGKYVTLSAFHLTKHVVVETLKIPVIYCRNLSDFKLPPTKENEKPAPDTDKAE